MIMEVTASRARSFSKATPYIIITLRYEFGQSQTLESLTKHNDKYINIYNTK
jgi:hypothetical protein